MLLFYTQYCLQTSFNFHQPTQAGRDKGRRARVLYYTRGSVNKAAARRRNERNFKLCTNRFVCALGWVGWVERCARRRRCEGKTRWCSPYMPVPAWVLRVRDKSREEKDSSCLRNIKHLINNFWQLFLAPAVNARCLPKLPPLTPDGKKDSALLLRVSALKAPGK